MARSGDEEAAERAELARELNRKIREIGGSLSGPGEASPEFTFYCECGCLGAVELTIAAFDAAGGALRDGHQRPDERI